MLLSDADRAAVLDVARAVQADFALRFPGDHGTRQPLHVVYGGLHLFTAQTPAKLGQVARAMLEAYAPTPEALASVFGLRDEIASEVHTRLTHKLETEPVEDYRLDAEDGYGHRSDDEEDGHARAAAEQVAHLLASGKAPPFLGLRVKPLSAELAPRALRTLEVFFSTLGGRTPPGFIVTLPKVSDRRQVEALAAALEVIEGRLGLPSGALKLEVMIESAPGLWEATGMLLLPLLVEAARGRLFGAHVGAYDYTASMDVAAPMQRLDHPACDHLRHLMKTAFSGTGVFLADGATTQLPIAPHKGAGLSDAQRAENTTVVHEAWRAHAANIVHALDQGFFQGWDLHPGQLVPRFALSYAFFSSNREAMTKRLSNFIAQLGRATNVGATFDDAATGQGLLNFFLRGWSCGALTDAEVQATGLSLEELRTRDFGAIVKQRQRR
ncbi:MAG: phosphoenolpyruvate kinase [Myxococcaceae bacterium]|nr:phosphoenolpyruvate kinase [Myxococcaceae bacterium]